MNNITKMNKKLLFLWLPVMLFVFCPALNAQNKRNIITGHITSNEGTLIGVNVVEMDANGRFISGTTTDMNGNFSLSVSNPNSTIMISYLGFKSQTFQINNQTSFKIFLEEDSHRLDEVVVKADKVGNDGIMNIRDRSTAISRLELKGMDELMTTNVEDMLQGRLGNVDITSFSGDPGAGVNIRIRGTATLNANTEPLILVNGIPYDARTDNFDFSTADVERFGSLIDVAAEDIESVEVLKDGASTAIWGSKAANGVLSIKTKRGTQSAPVFSYTFKLTRSDEPEPIPMLDAKGFTSLIQEAHFNVNAQSYDDPTIHPDPDWLLYHNYSQNTNWIKEITGTAYTTQNNFSVRGGGEKTRYDLSAGYSNEEGTTIGTRQEKINLRTALDYDLSSKMQIRTDVLFTRYDIDATYDSEDGDYDNKNIRTVAYKKMPNMSVYERDTSNNILGNYLTPVNTIQGNAKEYYNPVAFGKLGKNNKLKDDTRASFNLKYELIKSLTYESTITIDYFDEKRKKFLPYKAIGYNYDDDITNQAFEKYSKTTTMQTINQLIFKPTIADKHQFTGVLRFRTEDKADKTFSKKTSRSASSNLQEASGDVDIVKIESKSSKFRSASAYASTFYKYADKYDINFGLNYEGTSRYSEDSRWGFFPALSVGWRVSNEPLVNKIKRLDDLKLRLSWGVTGNAPSDNYLYFNNYGASSDYGYNGIAGVRPKGVELTGLKWETVEQINPGLTFVAFNNRWTMEVDYYLKHTRNLYIKEFRIPTHSGFGKINQNEGEMLNRGWEFTTDIEFFRSHRWNLRTNFNISTNENVVLRMPENYSLEYGDMLENGNYKINIEPGEAIGGCWGYEYLGVYKTKQELIATDINGNPIYDIDGEPLNMIHGSNYVFEQGDAKYKDQNYDGIIDELDLVYMGDLNPKLMGGFGPRISYKSKIGEFVLNGFFYFKLGQKIINQARMDTENMYKHDNQSLATNWRWRRPGDDTDIPRALYYSGYNWMGSSRFVEDGSFVRFKTVSLAYNLSENLCSKIKLKDLRVYVTLYNPYTWTNYYGQDPDVAQPSKPHELPKDKTRTPPGKDVILGVNITF